MTAHRAQARTAAAQLELTFASQPARARGPSRERSRAAGAFLDVLRAHGLTRIDRCRLTNNRTVMVSYRGAELRVHEGFVESPSEVLRAIVTFVNGRGAARREARRILCEHPIERPPLRRRATGHPDDARHVAELQARHAQYNQRRFGGALGDVLIRLSRRMTSRLGHYRLPASPEERGEIVISRRHLRRHGWSEVLDTLLHEMVHQWQHEQGLRVDHGPAFRRKAREVGILPSAKRPAGDGVLRRLMAGIFETCDTR